MNVNVHYIYQISLFKFRIDEIGLNFESDFVLASIYLPDVFVSIDRMEDVKLVKVSSYFYSHQEEQDLVHKYKGSPMLFGESLFFGGASRKKPNLWKLVGKIPQDRRLEDLPDLRSPDYNWTLPPERRDWRIIKNSLIFCEEAYVDSDYLKSVHLEVSTEYNYGVLLMRIYFELIKVFYIKSKARWSHQRYSFEIARCLQPHWSVPGDEMESFRLNIETYCCNWFNSGLVEW